MPEISGADGTATLTGVPETTKGVITTLKATSNGTVTLYEITSQDTADQLTIDNMGKISVNCLKPLDYEAVPSIGFTVVASDESATSGTATLTLPVADVNEAPAFQYLQRTRVLEDCVQAETAVSAGAADTNGLTCDFTDGNSAGDFSIVPTSGVVKVAAGKTLEAATTSYYILTVTCVDDGSPMMTSTSVEIFCIGSADNCPSSGPALVASSLMAMFVVAIVSLTMMN